MIDRRSLLLAVAGIGLGGCMGSSRTGDGSPHPSETERETPADSPGTPQGTDEILSPGEWVALDDWDLAFESVVRHPNHELERGEIVYEVRYAMRNTSNDDQDLGFGSWWSLVGEEEVYESDSEPVYRLSDSPDFDRPGGLGNEFPPGETMRGWMAVPAPPDWVPKAAVYTSNSYENPVWAVGEVKTSE